MELKKIIEELTPEELAAVLEESEEMLPYYEEAKQRATDDLNNSLPVPGWKLVPGRASRKFEDEDEAAKRMIADGQTENTVYDRKFIGIKRAEKLLGKAKFGELLNDIIITVYSSPKLAKIDTENSDIWVSIHGSVEKEK